MVKVEFILNEESTGEPRDWPAVPRKGDCVILKLPRVNGVGGSEIFDVVDVYWDDSDGALLAAVHLRERN